MGYAAGPSGNGSDSSVSDFYGGTFALTFVSTLNESYTTVPIKIKDANNKNLGNKMELALQGLPNKVITNVNVNVTSGIEYRVAGTESVAFYNFNIEFTGASVMGPQNLLIVEANLCDNGCTPKLTPSRPFPSPTAGNLPKMVCSLGLRKCSLQITTTTSVAAAVSATTIPVSVSASKATLVKLAPSRPPLSNFSSS